MLDGDESDDRWDANHRPLSPGQFGTVHIFPSIFRSTFFLLTRRARLDPSRAIMDLSRILPSMRGPVAVWRVEYRETKGVAVWANVDYGRTNPW